MTPWYCATLSRNSPARRYRMPDIGARLGCEIGCRKSQRTLRDVDSTDRDLSRLRFFCGTCRLFPSSPQGFLRAPRTLSAPWKSGASGPRTEAKSARDFSPGWAPLLLLHRRDVLFGHRGTLPEEELVQLLDDDFLIFPAGRIQAVFVQQHLAVFSPHSPGFLRHIVVDLAAQIVVEGRFVHPWHFSFQFHAENSVRHTLPSLRKFVYLKIITWDRVGNWLRLSGFGLRQKLLKLTAEARQPIIFPGPCPCSRWRAARLQK